MTALTIDIDDRLIHALREAAALRHTTIDAIVGERLEELATEGRRDQAREALQELVSKSTARMGTGYVWSREATYEDRMFPRHERTDLRGDGQDG